MKACWKEEGWKEEGASLEKREAILKEVKTVLEIQEVPKDKSVVEAIRTLENRYGAGI